MGGVTGERQRAVVGAHVVGVGEDPQWFGGDQLALGELTLRCAHLEVGDLAERHAGALARAGVRGHEHEGLHVVVAGEGA